MHSSLEGSGVSLGQAVEESRKISDFGRDQMNIARILFVCFIYFVMLFYVVLN